MDDATNSWLEASERYQEALPHAQRKRDGVWFTPIELARSTARRTLLPLLHGEARERQLRIGDPAVGGGSFLLAAAEAIRERRTVDEALTNVAFCGVDLNADAVQLAQQTLLAAGAQQTSMHTGNGLLEFEAESFDCILTNPPWETLQDGEAAKAQVAQLRPRFHHQGRGKLYTYRLFLERAVQLLRPGGRLGMIVPASLWFDRDAEPLRRLLLDTCDWQWLFGFENRKRIFAIDSRYRFGAIIATKGGKTKQVRVAFGRCELLDWAQPDPEHVLYQRDELQQLSPHAGTFVEVEHRQDLDILTRMHASGRPLLGDRGAFTWRQGDFNMTSDRFRFVLREQAEADGYQADRHGVWRCTGREDLLALRQGAMLYDLQSNAGAHDSGVGHKTKWRRPKHAHELRPLYLVHAAQWRAGATSRSKARIALRALSNATNERTAIACLLPDVPCGNSLGVLSPREPHDQPLLQLAAGTAILGSLPFDWALRLRLAGTNLNRFVLTDCMLPRLDRGTERQLAMAALQLCATTPWTEALWLLAQQEGWCTQPEPAIEAEHRRQLTTTIDTVVGAAFSLTHDDVGWITRGEPFAKGFWRLDRDLPEVSRRPNRWLAASAR